MAIEYNRYEMNLFCSLNNCKWLVPTKQLKKKGSRERQSFLFRERSGISRTKRRIRLARRSEGSTTRKENLFFSRPSVSFASKLANFWTSLNENRFQGAKRGMKKKKKKCTGSKE